MPHLSLTCLTDGYIGHNLPHSKDTGHEALNVHTKWGSVQYNFSTRWLERLERLFHCGYLSYNWSFKNVCQHFVRLVGFQAWASFFSGNILAPQLELKKLKFLLIKCWTFGHVWCLICNLIIESLGMFWLTGNIYLTAVLEFGQAWLQSGGRNWLVYDLAFYRLCNICTWWCHHSV